MADHRIGAAEDVHGRITDIYADNSGDGAVRFDTGLESWTYDLDAADELITTIRLAIARARDPR